MIKCGSVYLNPATIVAVIPVIRLEEGANVPIITPDGVQMQEPNACEVRFMGGGGTMVDCAPSEVVAACQRELDSLFETFPPEVPSE